MADLARRHEPRTGNPRAIWDEIDRLKAAVAFLRGSRGTVARAEFPTGIIPASALKQATAEPGLVSLTATGFSLSTTSTALLSATAVVPTGFSACVVSLVGRVFAANSTATAGYLSAQVQVAGVTGSAVPVHVGAAGATDDAALNVATFASVLTGLVAGDTVALQLSAWTDAATWSVDVSNLADLTGTIVWFA